jgi:PAS domain S-box-containing protein
VELLVARTLSEQLGGAAVAVNRRSAPDRVTTVCAFDPSPEIAAALAPVVGVEVTEAGTVTERVASERSTVLVPSLEPSYPPADAFPDPWLDFLTRHPVRSLVAAPIVVNGEVVGSLVAGRINTTDPFTERDAAAVAAAADRLAAIGSPGPEITPSVTLEPAHVAPPPQRGIEDHSVIAAAVGIAVPLVVALGLDQLDDATVYRPGVVLLTLTILVAVLAGFRAGLAAAVTSCVAIAVWFTDTPDGSAWVTRVVSVAVFAVGCVGVLLVVHRLDELRRAERRQRVVSDALLDGAPVGIALFDRDVRFERVNTALAELNGVSASDHIGRRPRDFNPAAGQLYEPLIESVRDSGESVIDRDLSLELPEQGIERYWKASYYPVRDESGTVVGVAAAVRDTTGDVVGRRRADALLSLARDLSEVVDRDGLVRAVTAFLAEAFQGRALVAFVDHERGRVAVAKPLAGYSDDVVAAWAGFVMPFERRTPLCDAVRFADVVHVGSDAEFADRYPDMEPERRIVGDSACVCVPVRDPSSGEVLAVFRVGWPHERLLTETSATLCGTVASLVALAWNRICLTEQLSADRFKAALDSMLDQVAIGRAERGADGEIVDFTIEYVNEASADGAGRTGEDLVGQSLVELYPAWKDSGMFETFARVVDTGEPYLAERLEYSDELEDGTSFSGHWNLQVVPFGDGYLAASRDVSEVVRLEQAERDAREVAERERVAVDLLQRAALPDVLPEVPGLGIAAIYRPASKVQPIGGDWYDAFLLPDGRLGAVIADVSGHGAEAAAFMVQVRNVFRGVAALRHQPDGVLTAVNEVVCGFGGTVGFFVTCCYCVVDPKSRSATWASAGHPPPIVSSRAGTALVAQRVGFPLAVAADAAYECNAMTLAPGARLLLYTDGLFERRNEPADAGLARLRDNVGRLFDVATPDLLRNVADDVSDTFDDLAALLIDMEST